MREDLAGLSYWQDKAILVTGASSGLGRVISHELLAQGARITAVARGTERLAQAFPKDASASRAALIVSADVTRDDETAAAVARTVERFGRIDGVIACAGRSDRGKIEDLTADRAAKWLNLNYLGAVRIVQAALPRLLETRGHVVLIGSLAAKTASPYMGAYPASKFPLAAYAQQLRLELGPHGLHVLLACPGPIARPDAGSRYDSEAEGLPEAARKPGGGARLKGIDPNKLAKSILRGCERRRAELVVPAKARALFVLQQLCPRWGDWLVKKMTR